MASISGENLIGSAGVLTYGGDGVPSMFGVIAFPTVSVVGSATGPVYAQGDLRAPTLTVAAVAAARGRIHAPRLTVSSTTVVNLSASATLRFPDIAVTGLATPTYAASGTLTFLTSTIVATTGAVAALTLPFPSIQGTAVANRTADTLTPLPFPTLTVSGTASTGVMAHGVLRPPTLEARWAHGALLIPTLRIVATATTETITERLANTVAYVLNINTTETTTYSHYPFMHIIHVGGLPYGVTPEGLYLLRGAKDGTKDINGTVTTKETDLGTFQSKYVPTVYMNTDTRVDVTPYVDSVVKPLYQGSFSGRKCHLARGLEGRYWRFKLTNIKMLEGLELLPEIKQRRVK